MTQNALQKGTPYYIIGRAGRQANFKRSENMWYTSRGVNEEAVAFWKPAYTKPDSSADLFRKTNAHLALSDISTRPYTIPFQVSLPL